MASKTCRLLALLAPLACSPAPGGEAGTATGEASTSGSAGVSSTSAGGSPTTGIGAATGTGSGSAVSTDAGGTSAGETSAGETGSGETTMAPPDPTSWTTVDSDDTTAGFVCNWQSDPEAEGFCPPAGLMNADISGTTPVGPIAFKFGYFGLYRCSPCPHASEGALVFFAAADGPAAQGSDRLVVNLDVIWGLTLVLGGEKHNFDLLDDEFDVAFSGLKVPSVAETNPPLDPGAPPVLSGKLTITGGGWDVAGSFTATLCRTVDPQIICD